MMVQGMVLCTTRDYDGGPRHARVAQHREPSGGHGKVLEHVLVRDESRPSGSSPGQTATGTGSVQGAPEDH